MHQAQVRLTSVGLMQELMGFGLIFDNYLIMLSVNFRQRRKEDVVSGALHSVTH